jgi:hypothetical protein
MQTSSDAKVKTSLSSDGFSPSRRVPEVVSRRVERIEQQQQQKKKNGL